MKHMLRHVIVIDVPVINDDLDHTSHGEIMTILEDAIGKIRNMGGTYDLIALTEKYVLT